MHDGAWKFKGLLFADSVSYHTSLDRYRYSWHTYDGASARISCAALPMIYGPPADLDLDIWASVRLGYHRHAGLGRSFLFFFLFLQGRSVVDHVRTRVSSFSWEQSRARAEYIYIRLQNQSFYFSYNCVRVPCVATSTSTCVYLNKALYSSPKKKSTCVYVHKQKI
jgi:hypothetical protein